MPPTMSPSILYLKYPQTPDSTQAQIDARTWNRSHADFARLVHHPTRSTSCPPSTVVVSPLYCACLTNPPLFASPQTDGPVQPQREQQKKSLSPSPSLPTPPERGGAVSARVSTEIAPSAPPAPPSASASTAKPAAPATPAVEAIGAGGGMGSSGANTALKAGGGGVSGSTKARMTPEQRLHNALRSVFKVSDDNKGSDSEAETKSERCRCSGVIPGFSRALQ